MVIDLDLPSVDDMRSPKCLGLSCEYCPFDYICGGRCLLGLMDDDVDDDDPKLPTVAS